MKLLKFRHVPPGNSSQELSGDGHCRNDKSHRETSTTVPRRWRRQRRRNEIESDHEELTSSFVGEKFFEKVLLVSSHSFCYNEALMDNEEQVIQWRMRDGNRGTVGRQ